ncbi:Techylectin-5A, partial [Araneus ventricosus]
NNKIFALTNQGQYSVRFDMTDDNGTSAFDEYKVFWIENEANKYKLHMSKYSGNAGNDKILALTNQGQFSVRFGMTDINGTSASAEYKVFWIENEENKYKLHISKCSGNAGDSLSTHSGAQFYTVDHPNQPKESKPEWIRSGGWWLNHIMTTSLNGLNILSTDKVQSMEGITWLTFGGFQNSLASTEIKVRPKKFKMHAKEKALSNV